MLDRISADSRALGVVLRIKNLDAGWASLEELRREILAFRARGGRVVAYLAGPADTRPIIWRARRTRSSPPRSRPDRYRRRARVDFLKDALDNLGLEAEVVAVSPYKSAGERFVPTTSPVSP